MLTEEIDGELERRSKETGAPKSWQVRQALVLYLDPNRLGAFGVVRSVLRQAQAAGVESAENALELLKELEG